MKEGSKEANCSKTKGAVSEERTAPFVEAIGVVGAFTPFLSSAEKGSLKLGKIGYILNLYIMQNCML
jgi:hypothetical protein